MRVRLTRKFADLIDGVDLTGHEVDEVMDVSTDDARILMAEKWAIAERRAMAERRGIALPHELDRRITDDRRLHP